MHIVSSKKTQGYVTQVCPQGRLNYPKGEYLMNLPETLASWCLWLFFLWYGLAAFVPALSTDVFRKIGAIFALGFFLFSLLGL